jgi:hypothetical protein
MFNAEDAEIAEQRMRVFLGGLSVLGVECF